MYRVFRGGVCAALIVIFALGLCLGAYAADFSDTQGHWAEDSLAFAAEKGWLTGFEDGTMRPDEKITGAQAAALITRILDAEGRGEGDKWYADAAAGAKELRIISGTVGLESALSRKEAFLMLSEAFRTYRANEDKDAFETYADTRGMSAMDADRIAGLINRGVVTGYKGSLNLEGTITRGEFAALLARLMEESTVDADGEVSSWHGDTLWIAAGADKARLSDVDAETVVIRSRELKSLKIEDCRIGTLVLAHNGGLTLKAQGIENIVVGGGEGSVIVNGDVQTVDLTGKRSLTLNGKVHKLTVTGADSTVTANGVLEKTAIFGCGTTLRGSGKLEEVYLRAPGCTITKRVKNLTDHTDSGIYGTEVKLTHGDEVLPAGETLTVTAKLKKAPKGVECFANWYIDGELVSGEKVSLAGNDEFTLNHEYFYKRGMNTDTLVRFELSYTTAYGEKQTASAEYVQKIENYPDDWVFPMDPERVLELVTTEYLGDYTLEWAQEHDYEPFEKEVWVNAKGFESSSQYLIWINQSHSRVNIFEGSQGSWKLIRSNIVACGADATSTPRGVFKTTWNQPIWNFGTYDVYPIVRFFERGYAFHSRLYYPGTEELMDGSIGFPASHGCIRMYLEDIRWIYDNVPSGTTVVSF